MPKLPTPLTPKAVLGAVVAGLGALITGYADDQLTTAEGLTACVALLVALGGVYAIPNSRKTLTPTTPTEGTPE